METTTFKKIIDKLRDEKVKFTVDLRKFIEDTIEQSVVESYAAGKRVGAGACDCG